MLTNFDRDHNAAINTFNATKLEPLDMRTELEKKQDARKAKKAQKEQE